MMFVRNALGGHAELTAAIASLSPTYSWDSTVASGNLTAIAGGVAMTSDGTGTPSYQQSIGSGDLLGVRPNGRGFDATLTLTDNQPFSFFCALNLDATFTSTNTCIAHTGLGGVASFNEGFLALTVGTTASLYGAALVSNVTGASANESPTSRTGTAVTYLFSYTGSAVTLWVNGVQAATTVYNSGVDHHGAMRLFKQIGTGSTGVFEGDSEAGYPAYWNGTALGLSDAQYLHVASGL